jgi:hypothetical protein
MLPFTTSLLRLSFLAPLEIARAYAEAFLPMAFISTPRPPAPKADRVPLDQSTNPAKTMSTQFYDTQVTTVAYQILFTIRDSEALLKKDITAVAKAMTGSGFTSWIIAQFIREIDKDGLQQPPQWSDEDFKKFIDGKTLKKEYLEFLQVEYQVLSTLDRKPPKYDKDEVDVLQHIASTLDKKLPDPKP